MQLWPMGVASSVSANHNFDPLDTLAYAKQGKYQMVQLYLTEALLKDEKVLKGIKKEVKHFEAVYFHADGDLNEDFVKGEYLELLHQFLEGIDD